MMQVIKNFNEKKVSDYLDTRKYRKVLLKFHHGLGDAMMFNAVCLNALKKAYPEIEFHYSTHLGQEELFGFHSENPEDYDIAFEFRFPMAEWDKTDETKAEKCLREEIGLEPSGEYYASPVRFKSPFVALHFFSTCMPNSIGFRNEPEMIKIWKMVEEHGFVPIDTHMRHQFDNSKNKLYSFQTRNMEGIPANISTLGGVLSVCRGFIGVASGNFPLALSILPPENILFIRTGFSVKKITRLPIEEFNPRNPQEWRKLDSFLERLKKV